MTTRPWYPFYWSDYSGKTMHLSQGQHGAYMLFLRWIYTSGKPIPDKHRLSIAQARLDVERNDAESVLHEFFVKRGDFWHNDRAKEVMKDAENRHSKLVEAGRLGGKHRSSIAQATTTITTPTEVSKNGKGNFSNHMGGNGNGFTVKDPAARLAKFQNWLAPKLGADLRDAWNVIALASDASLPGHLQAKETCRKVAIQNGKKGLPPQW